MFAYRSTTRIHRFAAMAFLTLLATAPAFAQELPSNQFKDGTVVREAFRDVVKEARHYTVEVIANGKQVALGTIVESDGYILTKASQLAGKQYFVKLSTGQRHSAELVGVQPEFDLALLKIEARNLPVVQWSSQFDLDLGRWLATPGTEEIPVAVGVVAVAPRSIPFIRGLLGVTFKDADRGGAEVTEVLEKSGAEKAGIRTGDILTMVNKKSIRTGDELRSEIQNHRPGEGVVLRIIRDGQEFDVIAMLGNPESRENNKSVMQNSWGPTLSVRRAGFASALQHDTVLSAEQCGGPVVDLTGKAIGINIARAGRTETFTLLVNQLSPIVAELKSGKLPPLQLEKVPQMLAETPEAFPGGPGDVFGDSQPVKNPNLPDKFRRSEPRTLPGGGGDRRKN